MSYPALRQTCLRRDFKFSVSGIYLLVVAVVALLNFPVQGEQPTVEYALGLKPRQEVEYDIPDAASALAATLSMEKTSTTTSWVVRAADGTLLRRFADTNNDRVVDNWSYYRDGMEVYRDIDSDHNAKPDQARWLGAAGSRWGIDADEDDRLESWKLLSAEEATAEIVAALRDRDTERFQRLLPTAADLSAAGFGGSLLEQIGSRVQVASRDFAALAKRQQSLTPKARWTAMLAGLPGVVPQGNDEAMRDIIAYDNVVAITEEESEGGGQVFVGTLIRCGQVWRPIDLPQLPDSGGVVTEAFALFTPRASATTVPSAVLANEELKPLMDRLRRIEGKMETAGDADRTQLVEQQVAVLEEVVEAAVPEERNFWVRQLAETLAAAAQEGTLEDGIERLEGLAAKSTDGDAIKAFLVFRLASARYANRMLQPEADVEEVQATWLAELADFVEAYPDAEDAAEAMLQISIADEFSGREQEALERYRSIVERYPESPSAAKAKGAARRLQLVGQPLDLSGTTVDGRTLSLRQFKGVPVLVHYWATWCEPCKVDMARIRELQQRYGQQKLAVVGIALDGDGAVLRRFLADRPLPWPQLHEPDGLDGRLAEELGVLTLPTMLLLDKNGVVVDRNLMVTELENRLEEQIEP